MTPCGSNTRLPLHIQSISRPKVARSRKENGSAILHQEPPHVGQVVRPDPAVMGPLETCPPPQKGGHFLSHRQEGAVWPRLSAQHVAPTIKHQPLPFDGAIWVNDRMLSVMLCVLAGPRFDRVAEAVMEDSWLRWIEIDHWPQS